MESATKLQTVFATQSLTFRLQDIDEFPLSKIFLLNKIALENFRTSAQEIEACNVDYLESKIAS